MAGKKGKKKDRNKPATTALTPYMANAIFRYESDTFSASGSQITREEAVLVANRVVRALVRGAQSYFDGITITNHLRDVRGQ